MYFHKIKSWFIENGNKASHPHKLEFVDFWGFIRPRVIISLHSSVHWSLLLYWIYFLGWLSKSRIKNSIKPTTKIRLFMFTLAVFPLSSYKNCCFVFYKLFQNLFNKWQSKNLKKSIQNIRGFVKPNKLHP